ncbi:MAG: hypothetical protein DMG04_18225 [Acidobacteria bacterium]|nr:MAG: hypothetical protein DMG04_18225 [Acidobacteriota bacterium]
MSRVGIRPTIASPTLAVFVVLALTAIRSGFAFVHEAPAALSFSFSNVARAAGLDRMIVYGGADANKYLLETTGTGVAAIDYDHDGWLDLFFVNGSTLEGFPAATAPTNHLYRNRRDGTFEDVTAKAGLAASGWGQGACGTPRPLRRQLHRSRPRHRADAGVGSLPLQRDQGRLRSAGTHRRQERAVSQSRQRRVRGRLGARGHHARERHVRPRREHARLRQRRLDRSVRRERLQSERALPQQPRRHVHRRRRHQRVRVQPGRQAAGRHGRRHRRLRSQRDDGRVQDELRGRHVDAVCEHGRRTLRGPDVRLRHRRQHALARLGHRLDRSRQRRLAGSVSHQWTCVSRGRATEDRSRVQAAEGGVPESRQRPLLGHQRTARGAGDHREGRPRRGVRRFRQRRTRGRRDLERERHAGSVPAAGPIRPSLGDAGARRNEIEPQRDRRARAIGRRGHRALGRSARRRQLSFAERLPRSFRIGRRGDDRACGRPLAQRPRGKLGRPDRGYVSRAEGRQRTCSASEPLRPLAPAQPPR